MRLSNVGNDDVPRQYSCAKAACAAYVRLGEDTPGNCRAIDYEALQQAMLDCSPATWAIDRGLRALYQRAELRSVFRRVRTKLNNLGHPAMWWLVYDAKRGPLSEDPKDPEDLDVSACGYSTRQVRRVLSKVDGYVSEELWERDMLLARSGADLDREEMLNNQERPRVRCVIVEVPDEQG